MGSRFIWFGVVSRQTLVRRRKASGATHEVCQDSDHFDRQESENPRIHSGLDRSHPSRVRGPVSFATLPDDIRESMTSPISYPRTSFRAESFFAEGPLSRSLQSSPATFSGDYGPVGEYLNESPNCSTIFTCHDFQMYEYSVESPIDVRAFHSSSLPGPRRLDLASCCRRPGAGDSALG